MVLRAHYIGSQGNLGPIGGPNGGAHLWNVIIGTGVASAVVTIYDGQDANGEVLAIIDASTVSGPHDFQGVWCKNGVFVVLSGADASVTVITD